MTDLKLHCRWVGPLSDRHPKNRYEFYVGGLKGPLAYVFPYKGSPIDWRMSVPLAGLAVDVRQSLDRERHKNHGDAQASCERAINQWFYAALQGMVLS